MTSTGLASRLVNRVAGSLATRVDRRSFLGRAAVVGSAVAVAPATYVLRPTSAYAAVCNCSGSTCDCGALCCDGYTEFCCTLNSRNACPPGTVAAGWWKVDGHDLCGGGPRYYLDCNSRCGACACPGGTCAGACSGTPCRCANGSCNNRKSGCTRFRYGQCHQEIACVGPIVCRVVTCTPPWQVDPTCTTHALVDNNTRTHDRPCLHAPFGSLDFLQLVGPAEVRVAGWVVDADTPDPISVHLYADGTALRSVPADRPRPDIADDVPGYGINHGFDATVAVPPNTSTLYVYAINTGHGVGNPHWSRPIPRLPFGAVDFIIPAPGGVRVRGWVIDPDTDNPVSVHVYGSGRFIGHARANQPRPDVERLYPSFGRNHGFDFICPAATGTHPICVYAINAASGASNPVLRCQTTRVLRGAPFGAFDLATRHAERVRVAGWAIDPDTERPVMIHVYVGGRLAGAGVANRDRADIGRLYPGWGPAHAFDFTVPAPGGPQQVCAYAINQAEGAGNPLLGCRTVT